MKMALYVNDGVTQFVLTAESEWEKKTVRDLSERLVTEDGPFGAPRSAPKAARIFKGGFYECQGGWVREGHSEDSLIVRFDTLPENM